jgi:hypothetical protein
MTSNDGADTFDTHGSPLPHVLQISCHPLLAREPGDADDSSRPTPYGSLVPPIDEGKIAEHAEAIGEGIVLPAVMAFHANTCAPKRKNEAGGAADLLAIRVDEVCHCPRYRLSLGAKRQTLLKVPLS